jgi:hypothetical protein
MCEYIAKYNIAGLDVPFTRYVRLNGNGATPQRDVMTRVSSDQRGHNRPAWGIPYYHYSVIKGVDPSKTRWTKMGVESEFLMTHWGPIMGDNSGAYDQPGFSLLMFAR